MKKQPGSGKLERYFQPSILMSLLKGPLHGYGLTAAIVEYGFIQGEVPPGVIYRHLRQMEEEGLLQSQWESEGTGPAKRSYSITPAGREVLESWIDYLERQAQLMLRFTELYRSSN